jgi:TonB family protein
MKKNKPILFYLPWLLMFVMLLPLGGLTQKILIDQQDNVANQRRIELAPLTLVSTSKTKLNFSIGTLGSSIYIRLTGSGAGTNIVNLGDKLLMYLENDSTLTVPSPKLQTYDVEEITTTYDHTFNISPAALVRLSKNNLKRIRKYHADGYNDVTVSNQNGRQVKSSSAFFLEELKKNNLLNSDTAFVASGQAPQDTINTTIAPQVVRNRMAAFPGGEDVWMNFLNKNIQVPAELKSNEKKVVMVQFVVKENGSINELEIVKSGGPAFDKEVLRVLKRMPYWKPAVEEGLPVASTVIKEIIIARENSSAGL